MFLQLHPEMIENHQAQTLSNLSCIKEISFKPDIAPKHRWMILQLHLDTHNCTSNAMLAFGRGDRRKKETLDQS